MLLQLFYSSSSMALATKKNFADAEVVGVRAGVVEVSVAAHDVAAHDDEHVAPC